MRISRFTHSLQTRFFDNPFLHGREDISPGTSMDEKTDTDGTPRLVQNPRVPDA
ncbi:MAG TPA: hypothetical protein VNA15_02255 [Candidatus Angelobacter sp.]|nr:hypothetical protein [Candidatus Angelobacter sp.]